MERKRVGEEREGAQPKEGRTDGQMDRPTNRQANRQTDRRKEMDGKKEPSVPQKQ